MLLFLAIPDRRLRLFGFAAIATASLCSSAFASDITVASPLTSPRLSSPVWIRAHNIGCEGVPPSAFGYSIDNSNTLVRGVTAYDIDVTGVTLSAGTHVVHFKSWTARGLCPVANVQFTVAGSSPPSLSVLHTAPVAAIAQIPDVGSSDGASSAAYGIPSYAVSFGDLDGKSGWHQTHDGGTPGSSRGSTVYPASTPLYDDAREFYMTYTDRAGERWAIDAGKAASPTHFVLDTYVYLPNPSEVMNLEMDINQVTSNGETVILSTQCAGNSGEWEAGYTSGKHDHWKGSGIKCDPRKWSAHTWHHVQIAVHRNSSGVVTHDWVVLDGVYHSWGYTSESAHFLGWEHGLVNVQYQIEGNNAGSGSVTSYVHKLTVMRW